MGSRRRTSLLNSAAQAITIAITPAIYKVSLVPIHREIGPAKNNLNGANIVDPSASYAPTKANRNYNLILKHAW